MPSAVSARSLRCCAIRSPGTAADRPPVSSAPMVFIFLPSISISSVIKRFQPDKMLILVVCSGQRPFLPDVFLVRCPFIGILISSAASGTCAVERFAVAHPPQQSWAPFAHRAADGHAFRSAPETRALRSTDTNANKWCK